MDANPKSCPLLKVGQLAKKTGKTARAIRFYEDRKLLFPEKRTDSGYRLYGEDAVLRIEWIDRLQEMGFSLAEVADFMSSLKSLHTGPVAMERLRSFYAAKLDDARNRIARLERLAEELEGSISYLDACQSCSVKDHPSLCLCCDRLPAETPRPQLVFAAVKAITS